MILGLAALLANSICPYLSSGKVFTHGGVTDFHGLFLVPMAAALRAAALVLALFFHPPPRRKSTSGG